MSRARERLKDWREAKGWSQTQAGKEFGVTQGTWSAWESGQKRPSIEQLVQIAARAKIAVSAWVETDEERAERQAAKRTRKRRLTDDGPKSKRAA